LDAPPGPHRVVLTPADGDEAEVGCGGLEWPVGRFCEVDVDLCAALLVPVVAGARDGEHLRSCHVIDRGLTVRLWLDCSRNVSHRSLPPDRCSCTPTAYP